MAQNNRIEKVAIVGATGRIGKYFAEALLKTGKHTVTALTRLDSKGTLPSGVHPIQVDYDSEDSLTSALHGQQFLIITLSVTAPPDLHSKIVAAAAKAGVPYIMPNTYGVDIRNEHLKQDPLYGAGSWQKCLEIEHTGVSAYVAMVCGFWYEWSLALGEPWFGFDIKKRTVTFYDEGETKICSSTWISCGKALAALLSLPIKDDKGGLSVEGWKNEPFYFSDFRVSQRDMLDSLNRVLGTRDKDWEISYEKTGERFQKGMEELKSGVRTGFAKAL